jgi:TolA-binding protein
MHHMGIMPVFRTASILLPLVALVACGSPQSPEAAPGAVERTTAQLDRDDAREKSITVRRIEDEAEARSDRFDGRIAAIEKESAKRD